MEALSADFVRNRLFGGEHCPRGGQELIALEIVAALKAYRCISLWLPFSLGPLVRFARMSGIRACERQPAPGIDSMYLGTPTIVANKKLFDESHPEAWTKAKERRVVRLKCAEAEKLGARIILTGLGSGDITVANRIRDMTQKGWTKPKVICMKDFGEFIDHILITSKEKES